MNGNHVSRAGQLLAEIIHPMVFMLRKGTARGNDNQRTFALGVAFWLEQSQRELLELPARIVVALCKHNIAGSLVRFEDLVQIAALHGCLGKRGAGRASQQSGCDTMCHSVHS